MDSDTAQLPPPNAPPDTDAPETKAIAIDEKDMDAAQEQAVKNWNRKVGKAKERYAPDFKRMRENMAFVSGRQWPDQKTIQFDRYVSNVTLKVIQGIQAQLYAKNPKCSVTRKKRRDFEIWDEKIESLQAAKFALSTPPMPRNPEELVMQQKAMMQAQALMNDVQMGEQWRKMVDKVAETMELVYDWQIDNLEPNFKEQMKQLVFDALVCGVEYVILDFSREYEGQIATSETESTVSDRVKRMKFLLEKLEKGEITQDSKDVDTMKQLALSIGVSVKNNDLNNVNERLCWNFLHATSIIPDENCTRLRGFVNADWVCHECHLPLDAINAFFETNIDPGQVSKSGSESKTVDNQKGELDKPKVCLRHIWQLSTKCHFFIIDGYKKYVQEPEPLTPETNRFWPVHQLVFVPVKACDDEGAKTSIFPPSFVDLVRPAQEEWNRCRETLRDQRKANQPKYICVKGKLSDGDKAKLQSASPNEIIELDGLPPDVDINKVLIAFRHDPINGALYDVSQSLQDIMMTSSSQEAHMGNPGKRVTATGETIAEQSRTSLLGCYVDTLDEFLSGMARQAGEMLLRELSPDTAKRIAGRGAVWPSDPKQVEEFIQAMFLDIKAASSGKPNQALHIANAERLAPLMIQAGANPKAMVRVLAHLLDETMDETDFFPLTPPMPAPSPAGGTPPKHPAQPHNASPHAGPPQAQNLKTGHPVLPAA